MNTRQLLLLSPYRLPTENTLYLGDEEVSAFLNGHAALWHPAALAAADAPPRVVSPYDHEQPDGAAVYAVPDNPPLTLTDDWEQRARDAGAVVFTATADRGRTVANLIEALRAAAPDDEQLTKLAALPPERVAPFAGLGFGHLVLDALVEAMQHDNVLAAEELWQDVAAAVAAVEDADAMREHVQSAADRLLAGREVLYPVGLFVIDLALPDETDPAAAWPASAEAGQPFNVIASGRLLERLAERHPERLALLREKIAADLAEVAGGAYREKEDPLLPLESQLWNLRRGRAVSEALLGREVRVFGRRRFGYHAQLPLLLQSAGFSQALLIAFDEAVLPAQRSPVVSWPSHNGKQIDCFTRAPLPADSPQTGFHLAHHLHQTIMQDQTATLALLHRDQPAATWYHDWLELTRLSPVLGRWTTLSGYFAEVTSGDYMPQAMPDEFQADYLVERTSSGPYHSAAPVSGFAVQQRGRRRLDAAWTFAALLGALGGQVEDVDGTPFAAHLEALEGRFETDGADDAQTQEALDRAAAALGQRIVARGQPNNPGYLLLNPCSFTRRVVLELPGITAPLPLAPPLKACQVEGDVGRVVVELPAGGFAWVPRQAGGGNRGGQLPPLSPAPAAVKMKLADERCVRNEFFEAEIDPQTGGLRGLRDQRTRISRLGGMLVFNPGSVMQGRQVRTTSTGPALGEIISEGVLLDDQGQELATFRQRFRAWLGRPLLEMRIELQPLRPPEGYPWHAYYGARFAWREESAAVLRGSSGLVTLTSQTRPESPDFVEVRSGRHNTVIFPGGLPFHQRHGGRMLDVILLCEGESARVFELGISMDREAPTQTALGLTSPVGVVPTEQGPPHIGATGWLFHLDASNVLLTSLRPTADGAGLIATLQESGGHGGPVNFSLVKNPTRAVVQDLRGQEQFDATVAGDAVQLEVSPNDLLQLRVDFR